MGAPLVTKLELDKRSLLSEMLRSAREGAGWDRETAAERATEALRRAPSGAEYYSPAEVILFAHIEVSRHHVAGLEGCPAQPLGSPKRRACLLGLVLALGLDRALVNRLAGAL